MILGGDTLFFQKDMEPILKEFESRPDCSLVRYIDFEIEVTPNVYTSGHVLSR